MRTRVQCPRCYRTLARRSHQHQNPIPDHYCPHRVHCTETSDCKDCRDRTPNDVLARGRADAARLGLEVVDVD